MELLKIVTIIAAVWAALIAVVLLLWRRWHARRAADLPTAVRAVAWSTDGEKWYPIGEMSYPAEQPLPPTFACCVRCGAGPPSSKPFCSTCIQQLAADALAKVRSDAQWLAERHATPDADRLLREALGE